MTAQLIDGKAAALALRARIADDVVGFREAAGRAPGLAVVLVGEHPPSAAYVRSKAKATREAGMESFEHNLPADISRGSCWRSSIELNADERVDGILVQLPLPPQIDAARVIARIRPDKDVDGFHPVNAGRLATGLDGSSPARRSVALFAQAAARRPVRPGCGRRRPLEHRRQADGAAAAARKRTVTIAHRRTKDLPEVVRRADIVVAAVGSPEMVRGDWIKPGATVIDVGIRPRRAADDGKGQLVGDVAYDEALRSPGRSLRCRAASGR